MNGSGELAAATKGLAHRYGTGGIMVLAKTVDVVRARVVTARVE